MFKIVFFLLIFMASLYAKEINIDKAALKARDLHKHLFVFLHKTDCGYCESMIQFTFEDELIKPFIKKNFLYLSINVNDNDIVSYKDFKGSGREFAKSIGYDFYPTALFFDKMANIVEVEVGYIDSEKIPNEKRFYEILKSVKNRSYMKIEE